MGAGVGGKKDEHGEQTEFFNCTNTFDVIGDGIKKEKSGKSAGSNNDEVVNDLYDFNLEQFYLGLNNAKVESCQKIESPNQKTPEAKLYSEWIGETVLGLLGIDRKFDQREHDQTYIQS
jgi:hypothetical protein